MLNNLTPGVVRALFQAATGDRYGALNVLAVNTGLREDGLLGLRWDDLDLVTATLRVQRTLHTGAFHHLKVGQGL